MPAGALRGSGREDSDNSRVAARGTRRLLSPSPGCLREEVPEFLLLPSFGGEPPQAENSCSPHGGRVGAALKHLRLDFTSPKPRWGALGTPQVTPQEDEDSAGFGNLSKGGWDSSNRALSSSCSPCSTPAGWAGHLGICPRPWNSRDPPSKLGLGFSSLLQLMEEL